MRAGTQASTLPSAECCAARTQDSDEFSTVGYLTHSSGTANLFERPTAGMPARTALHMATGTVRLDRVVRAPPERVYRAFLNSDGMAKWLPPNGFTGKVQHMDAEVRSRFRMTFTNFSTGQSRTFGGEYPELIPNERICYTDQFEDPCLPGIMKTTLSLKPGSCDTELDVVQEGLPEVIPVDACKLGWQESLVLLAKLVEAVVRRHAPSGDTSR